MSLRDGTKTSRKSRFQEWFNEISGLGKYNKKEMNWFLYGLVLVLWPFHWLSCFWVFLFFLICCVPLALLDWCLDWMIKMSTKSKRLLIFEKCCRIVKIEVTSILDVFK